MLHCKFSGDYNSERNFKIGQYLTKLCVEHLGFTFLAHSVCVSARHIGLSVDINDGSTYLLSDLAGWFISK